MRVMMIGASKGIGMETTRQALDAGSQVRALALSDALHEPSQWRNGMISRADVANFLVRQIEDQADIRQAPMLID